MDMTTDAAEIEDILKQELNTVKLIDTGIKGDGAISSGCSYDTDRGRVFVKINKTTLVIVSFLFALAQIKSLINKQFDKANVYVCLSIYYVLISLLHFF